MISIGIDVSKGSSTVCILKPFGEVIHQPFQVTHNKTDLEEFLKTIKSLNEETKIIMEATGHYHLPLVCFFEEQGLCVSVINPMLMKKYASVSLRKGKTDKMDAIKIAKFGIDYWYELKEYQIETDVYYELRLLSRKYFEFMSLRIKQKVMLSNLLDQTMPGINTILSSNSPHFGKDKTVDFAYKYWHYDNIIKLSEKKFTESYEKWAKKEGYHFSENKAHLIYHHAKNSITTLPSKIYSTQLVILETIEGLLQTTKSLSRILARMQELAKGLPEYSVVREMPGIGDKLAPRLIAEIGDIKNYHSAKALIAYAGIDAPPYQSGNFNGTNRKISKRGSRYLRKIGYEAMQCIKRTKPTKDTAVYEYILKKEKEGKAKKQAKIAGLNKFLRIYYSRVHEVIEI